MTTHRMRRGRLVEIPEQWQGKVTRRQTIRKRQSKTTRKLKNELKFRWPRPSGNPRHRAEGRAPKVEEWE